MTALALTHKIGRGLAICALSGLAYNLYQIYHLDLIAPYGIQSILFLNAFVVFLALIYLEKSPFVLYTIGGILALFSIALSIKCYFDQQQLPAYWNLILLTSATVISLTLFERLRKKSGSLARLSVLFCILTMLFLGFILITKHKEEFIHTLFMMIAFASILLMAIAIVFYARKDQSTKVP
jgi:hypothetical protein